MVSKVENNHTNICIRAELMKNLEETETTRGLPLPPTNLGRS